MHGCCKNASVPDVIIAGDRPSMLPLDAAKMSARLLEGAPCPLPPSHVRDLRALLSDFGNRQEHLFRQVLEQQKKLEGNLMVMQSASKANAAAQDTFFAEFREFARYQGWSAQHNGDASEPPSMFLERVEESPRSSVRRESHYLSQIESEDISPPEAAKTPSEPNRMASASHKSALRFHHQQTKICEDDNSVLSRINYLLKCKEFELAIAFAIITNAFIMCWECQYQGLDVGYHLQFPGRQAKADIVWTGAETAFNVCDWSFGILFATEMLVKLICWRSRYFYDSDEMQVVRSLGLGCCGSAYRHCAQTVQGWNLLDFFCVAAFLFDKLAAVGAINPQMLRLLRLFRLFRLIRLLRFLETLDHLYVMTTAISGLSKVLTWAIILLSILLLICNLFLVQILQATYFSGVTASDLTEESLKNHHKMYEYFGTCTRCMLSMFEITLGNWPPVARLLSEEVSEWFTFFCIVHKLTIGFAVIGVITGVILQETFKVAQTDDIIMFRQKKTASRILRQKMNVLFQTLDTEGDGRIQVEEFMSIAKDPEIKLWLASLDIETDDLRTLFNLIDTDRSGYIELDEMVARMPRIKGFARSIDMLAMLQEFRTESRPSKK